MLNFDKYSGMLLLDLMNSFFLPFLVCISESYSFDLLKQFFTLTETNTFST
jgi:hypothetical protein